jgi:hypothetical protein
MDKVLDNLTHLVRDIFFYFIPGAIIIFLTRDHSFIHSYESFGKNFKFESSYFHLARVFRLVPLTSSGARLQTRAFNISPQMPLKLPAQLLLL